jgi:hypothetical protein
VSCLDVTLAADTGCPVGYCLFVNSTKNFCIAATNATNSVKRTASSLPTGNTTTDVCVDASTACPSFGYCKLTDSSNFYCMPLRFTGYTIEISDPATGVGSTTCLTLDAKKT